MYNKVLEKTVVIDYKQLENVRHVNSYRDITEEWHDLLKRNRKERIVEIGMSIG